MKSKQTQFLQQLGYTIEDITYKVGDIQHEETLAYKTENKIIQDFKEKESHQYEIWLLHGISNYRLEYVYNCEFKDTLHEIALEHIKRWKN